MRIIQGEKLEDILATTTVEGVPTAEVAMHFGQLCGLQVTFTESSTLLTVHQYFIYFHFYSLSLDLNFRTWPCALAS